MKEKFDGHTPAWIAEKKTWNLRTACVCREQPGHGWSFIFAAVGTLRPGEHAHGRRRAVGCRWPTAKVGTSGGSANRISARCGGGSPSLSDRRLGSLFRRAKIELLWPSMHARHVAGAAAPTYARGAPCAVAPRTYRPWDGFGE